MFNYKIATTKTVIIEFNYERNATETVILEFEYTMDTNYSVVVVFKKGYNILHVLTIEQLLLS